MGYDDAKVHEGQVYSGMRVGGRHDWDYVDGRWQERKLAPDRWSFTFRANKRRRTRAPVGSGAPPDTMFHWYLLAHQRVRKLDEDTYQTFLEGTKWKVGHRRPTWRKWSSEYRHHKPARDKIIEILRETLAELEADKRRGAQRLEMLLDPSVLAAPDRVLEEWDIGELEVDEAPVGSE